MQYKLIVCLFVGAISFANSGCKRTFTGWGDANKIYVTVNGRPDNLIIHTRVVTINMLLHTPVPVGAWSDVELPEVLVSIQCAWSKRPSI